MEQSETYRVAKKIISRRMLTGEPKKKEKSFTLGGVREKGKEGLRKKKGGQ